MTTKTNLSFLMLFLSGVFFSSLIDCATLAKRTEPLEIRRVKLDSKTINPSKGRAVTLSFEVMKSSHIQVHIYDLMDHEVKNFEIPDANAGEHSIKWDGRNTAGKQATGNLFLYIIEANDGRTETIYNPAQKSAGEPVKTLEFTLDRKTGKLEYVLPKTCMVRLRAGFRNAMLARTLIDWRPQTAGRHTLKWDGKDESGVMNLLNHPELEMNLMCYTLPANTILVEGPAVPLESTGRFLPPKSRQTIDVWGRKGKYFHYTHDPRNCHEPRFAVSFPNSKSVDAEDIPKVSGKTKVRIELDPRDKKYLINKRFEIMLYIDGIYFFELEEGTSPFTLDWNTEGLRKGSHVLTINILSYDGHIGVVNRRVIIGE